MCGIAGFVGSWDIDRTGCLTVMLDALDHRGPDDRGHHVDDDVAIGMTRLSIIDLSGGDQPKSAAAGRWQVVFNGELYNFRALRQELRVRGHAFASASDTEVVAHAIAEWDTEAIRRFDGMFAVAAWDRDTGRLVLARDRFGEKPLHLRRDSERLAFASELKALRPLFGVAEPDHGTFLEYLHRGYIGAPRSIFANVEKLPPGHVAVWHRGRLSVEPYWSRSDVTVQDTPPDAVTGLASRLREAVRTRLVADVEVGVLLSGGIDSSLVAWAAAEEGARFHTFSVGFDDPDRDESPYARMVAEQVGSTHHHVHFTADDARHLVPELPAVYDEPFADQSAIPTLLVCRFASSRVKVVLAGDGGDELFSGYPRYRDVRSAARMLRFFPARLAAAMGHHSAGPAALRSRAGWGLTMLGSTLAATYDNRAAAIPWALVRWLTDVSPATPRPAIWDFSGEEGAVRNARLADVGAYLPDDLLVKVDRASMSTSLEVRAPFLAPSIADWALALPEDVVGAPGEKALPRALASQVLPREIAEKPKQGFSVPLARWLRGPLRREVEGEVRYGAAIQDGWVRADRVDAVFAALDAGHDRVASIVWSLFMYERWRQRWVTDAR